MKANPRAGPLFSPWNFFHKRFIAIVVDFKHPTLIFDTNLW